jgi:phage shock protein A
MTQLKDRCAQYGIPQDGRKQDLEDRIAAHELSLAEQQARKSKMEGEGHEAEQGVEVPQYLAILMEHFDSESFDEPELAQEATQRLDSLLTTEALTVDEIAEKTVIGNDEGIEFCRLVTQLRSLPSKIKNLEKEMQELKTKNHSQQTNIASLQEQLSTHLHENKSYMRLRNRFLSVYKRDKLFTDTENDRKPPGG